MAYHISVIPVKTEEPLGRKALKLALIIIILRNLSLFKQSKRFFLEKKAYNLV
jgi:hypothetical protein